MKKIFLLTLLTVHSTIYSQSVADGFDYPIGNRGYNANTPITIPEGFYSLEDLNTIFKNNPTLSPNRCYGGGSGWKNMSDVGNFVSTKYATYAGLHPAEDWNYGGSGADIGKEVYAIANGEVWRIINNTSSDGHMVILKHIYNGQTYYSIYQHITAANYNNQDNLSGTCINNMDFGLSQYVQRGQLIGRLANIVNKKGENITHLHFEIRDGNKITLNKNGGSVNSQGNIGSGLYPLGRSNGYYTISPNISWNSYNSSNSINSNDVNTAIINMKLDGILDPSDFIDANRPGKPLNQSLPIFGGSKNLNPKLKLYVSRKDFPIGFKTQYIDKATFKIGNVTQTGVWFSKPADSTIIISHPITGVKDTWYNFDANLSSSNLSSIPDGVYQTLSFEYNNNGNKKTCSSSEVYFGDYQVPIVAFTDIMGTWAEPQIRKGAQYGLFRGSSISTFNPKAVVTREEAAKMLMNMAIKLRLCNLDQNAIIDYTGAKSEFVKYILAMKSNGYTTANSFNASSALTVGQLCKFVVSIFESKLTSEDTSTLLYGKGQRIIATATDASLISYMNTVLKWSYNKKIANSSNDYGRQPIWNFYDFSSRNTPLSSNVFATGDREVTRDVIANLITNLMDWYIQKTGIQPRSGSTSINNFEIIGEKYDNNTIVQNLSASNPNLTYNCNFGDSITISYPNSYAGTNRPFHFIGVCRKTVRVSLP